MGILGFDITKETAKIWDDGNTRFLATNVQDIGASLVTLLRDADVRNKVKNKYVHISSFAATQNEILSQLERTTGSAFTVTRIDSNDIKDRAFPELATGNSNAVVQLIQYIALGKDGLSQWYSEAEHGNKILLPNNPGETLEETVRRVVREFRDGKKSS